MPKRVLTYPESYAVVWRKGDGRRCVGSLVVTPDGVQLAGRNGCSSCSEELPFTSLARVRIGRLQPERIDGSPTLVLEEDGESPLFVGSAAGIGTLHELADRLAPLAQSRPT